MIYRSLFSAAVLILFSASSTLAAENELKDVKGKHLDIIEDGKVVARFMYEHDTSSKEKRHDTYKPYLHVIGPDGAPITKGPGGQFTHHRGIFLGWSRIGFQGKSYDLWHMKTSEIIHQEFLKLESGDEKSVVVAKLNWMDSNGKVILEEHRTMTFHHGTGAHVLIDFDCNLNAVTDDVVLGGDPEHAGFQYRPADEVSKNKSAKYQFHADGIDPKKNFDLPWVGMQYSLGKQFYSVQHMRHADNPENAIYSAYRDYGRFGSFPKINLKKGESKSLKYRIRVTAGKMPSKESMASEYKKYSK